MPSGRRSNAGGSIRGAPLGTDDEGNERARTKGKRFGGETPTDARLFCRAEDGHGRAWIARRTSIGVPPRFSPQGVFHRKGRSLRPGFLGRGGDTFCASL